MTKKKKQSFNKQEEQPCFNDLSYTSQTIIQKHLMANISGTDPRSIVIEHILDGGTQEDLEAALNYIANSAPRFFSFLDAA